jgi:hypothetical protein
MLGKNQECWAEFFYSSGWQMYVFFVFVFVFVFLFLF